ncbi:ankyrin repeat domain-containing protein [Magnetovirga frankeli]|uniref:ankyrin repeat domain-containing protein n=1 Tax=Magnetovirga frankeli TaxID=947516 RepID=UPI001AF0708A|nr:ankyrin repeat domain-containing protein [gamma proteobacterium SS-5]
MNEELRKLLMKVQSTPDHGYVKFDTINDVNELGDNALHCVCYWGDYEAAKLLVENGIEVNQRGEYDFTPLDVAIDEGHQMIVDYLKMHGGIATPEDVEGKYDREKHNRHMRRLSEEIEILEEQVKNNCDDCA